MHDTSHAIARYIQSKDQDTLINYTPTPFLHPYRWIPEYPDALREELFALLWLDIRPYLDTRFYEDRRAMNLFMKKIQGANKYTIKHYHLYMKIIHKNFLVFKTPKDSGLAKERGKLTKWELFCLWIKSKWIHYSIWENPDPKLVELLTYIVENQSNPRVVLDLFLQEMQPLIDQLKKRKPYTWKKEKK